MPRTCTICQHPHRAEVEEALMAGTPYRHIASQHGVSYKAVERHKEHIPVAIAQAQEAKAEAQALDVVRQLKAINAASVAILQEARSQRDPDTALKAIDRIHRQIELQAKLLGELNDQPTINILLSPEWVEVRTVIVQALAPFADARTSVVQALSRLEGKYGRSA